MKKKKYTKGKKIFSLLLVTALLIPSGIAYGAQYASSGEPSAVIQDAGSGNGDGSAEPDGNDQELPQEQNGTVQSEEKPQEAQGKEKPQVQSEEKPQKDQSGIPGRTLEGSPLHFVNLYWETDAMGAMEAVFGGGTSGEVVLEMKAKDRGVYEVLIPAGSFSRVAFRVKGSKENLPGSSFNLWGADGPEEIPVVNYEQKRLDTFYYDMGDNPSYWGSDPEYEAPAANAKRAASQGPASGDMIYAVDLMAVEAPDDPLKSDLSRINIAFLKYGHEDPFVLDGTDGEEYTMYERENGLYSAPFPANVDSYEEIVFQLVKKGETEGAWLDRHYNFRGKESGVGDRVWGYFTYEKGLTDTFYLNRDGSNTIIQDSSYWGAHSTRANDSLDTQVLYVDVADLNGNGIVANIDDMWISWEGMRGNMAGGTYEPGKGYRIKNLLAKDTAHYFQFPYNSGQTENSVLTLKYTVVDENGNPTQKYGDKVFTYKFLLIPRSGRNCLQLDYVWDFNGQMWTSFEVGKITERILFFHNIKTKYSEVQMRLATSGNGSYVTADELKTGFNWTDEEVEKYVVQDGENCWLRLQKLTDQEAETYNGKTELYQLEIPSAFTHVQFRGKKGTEYFYTNREQINDRLSYPCFYPSQTGSKADTAPNEDVKQPGISGFWRSAYSADTSGDESIDIPADTFVREENVYYGSSTFYDYYSTLEMTGKKVAEGGITSDNAYRGQAEMFNQAAAAYYEKHASSIEGFQALYPAMYNGALYKGNHDGNNYRGYTSGVFQGMVDTHLTKEGAITSRNVELPLYNKEFLRGNNDFNTAVGNVYENVLFPFDRDTDADSRTYGYWVFDSSRKSDAVRLSYDADAGYFLKKTEEPILFRNIYGFFPYNDQEDISGTNSEADKFKLNCLFGTRLNLDFSLTEDAAIHNEYTGQEEPIRFEFQGDDDVWIYIDGILALDMGGMHDAARGEINFKEGTYTIKKQIRNSGQHHYNEEGVVDKSGKLPDELLEKLQEPGSHTLTMFHMERGLYESNLKISFNFPRENTFSVEKEVDITANQAAGGSIFDDLLLNMGGFNFQIKNLVTSGENLPVEQSVGYVTPGEKKVLFGSGRDAGFFMENGAGTVTKEGESYHVQQHDSVSGLEPDEKTILKITPEKPMDITDMSYLRMVLTNLGANDLHAGNLYLSFVDSEGRRVGAYANAVGYDGESNSFLIKESSIIRIDYRNMQGDLNFDWSKTAYMLIGIRKPRPEASAEYLVTDISFLKTRNTVPVNGFGVSDEQISDYGSYDSGALTAVNGAWYLRQNKTGKDTYDAGVLRSTDQGEFSLADGQRVLFTDKFRSGSYLELQELHVDPRVFDTEWSILEDGKPIPMKYLLSTRSDVISVKNPLDHLDGVKEFPLNQIQGTDIFDGRIENVSPDWVTDQYHQPDQGRNRTMVYRSYRDPDITSSVSVNLGVQVKNTLKYGSVTIEKQLSENMKDEQSGKYPEGDYLFDIYYTDIAGMGLEHQLSPVDGKRYVRQTVKVHVDSSGTGSVTVPNIPAGTMYRIVERPGNGAKLVDIDIHEEEKTLHEGVRLVGLAGEGDKADYTSAYVEGTAYASSKTFTFTNENEPFYMDIEKVWRDGLTEEERAALGIAEVHIRLQRRMYQVNQDPENGWENVTRDYFGNYVGESGEEYLKLTADHQWKSTSIKILPAETTDGAGNIRRYEYRIQELASDGSLKNYDVTYHEVRNPDKETPDGGKHFYVTYQAVNTPVGIELAKIWDDHSDMAGVRPDKVRVKLVGSSAWDPEKPDVSVEWKCYRALEDPKHVCDEDCWFELAGGSAWKRWVSSLPKMDEKGKLYYYKLAEEEILRGTDWISAEEHNNDYQVVYSEPVQPKSDGRVSLTVSNHMEHGRIVIEKKDQDTRTALAGAEFKLERLIWEQGAADEDLKVDETFQARTGTSSEAGSIQFQELPYGKYKITEIKAPGGYIALKQPIYITLDQKAFESQSAQHQGDLSYDSERKTITVTIYNEKGLHLPITGGRGMLLFAVGGVILLCAGMFGCVNSQKKRRYRKNG